MGLFKAETYQLEKEKNDINPFAPNVYNCTVQEVKVVEVNGTDWSSGNPVKTDKKVDNIKVFLTVDSCVDGSPVIGMNGHPTTFNTVISWIDPLKTGITKKGATKARVFLTTLMDWPLDQEINTSILEDLIVNNKMIGRTIRATIGIVEKEDGSKNNKIENIFPAKK